MLDHWWPPDVPFPLECHLKSGLGFEGNIWLWIWFGFGFEVVQVDLDLSDSGFAHHCTRTSVWGSPIACDTALADCLQWCLWWPSWELSFSPYARSKWHKTLCKQDATEQPRQEAHVEREFVGLILCANLLWHNNKAVGVPLMSSDWHIYNYIC